MVSSYPDLMATIFTRIIDGEIPGAFVWDDDRCVAFLSINPLKPGHTLVVPRQEIDHWLDCPADLWDHLMSVAQTLGRSIAAEWQPERVGLMIVGDEVPHLHIHLVPIWGASDLDFSNAAPSVPRDELEANAERIKRSLEN